MMGYDISRLSNKTQKLIKNENIDKNSDGLINVANGELAELLSKTGKKDINDLCYNSYFDAKKEDFFAGGGTALLATGFGLSAKLFSPRVDPKAIDTRAELLFLDKNKINILNFDPIQIREGQFSKYYPNARVKKSECLAEILKQERKLFPLKASLFGFFSLATIAATALTGYLFCRKPQNAPLSMVGENKTPDSVALPNKSSEAQSKSEIEFKNAFDKINEVDKYELKEYIPQKGEYWISILMAKYGTDYDTALDMAHKIKEMIYDDPKASKQSPVMYLPDVWKFKGKTYQYNEAAIPQRSDNFSEDAKTDMGKMSKDLQY